MRKYCSDDGLFVIGSLVKVITYPSDQNNKKIGLIISGAHPFHLENMAEIVIENWLFRESIDDGFLLEPSYIVRIENNDWIYSESELEIINSPTLCHPTTGSFG